MSDFNLKIDNKSHNPYFNRWFSAIQSGYRRWLSLHGHNPYFNRWFSAIGKSFMLENALSMSQSLF